MIDLCFVGLVAIAASVGWLRGLAISLVAAVVFLVAGLPVAALLSAIDGDIPPVLGMALGGMFGLVAFALRGEWLHTRIEEALPAAASIANRIAGAAVNTAIAVALGWFVAAVATVVPGSSGTLESIRASAMLGTLVEELPPAGPLGALVLRSGLVPALNGPLVLAEPPDPSILQAQPVRQASNSVVQVRGIACDALVTGSAWVAGPGLLVTNAHVVAGQSRTYIAGGPRFRGLPVDVTAIDPLLDVAVLAVRGAGLPPVLSMRARFAHGEPVVVIGYPLGGESRLDAARLDRVASFPTEPVGGGPAQPAPILAARGRVESGNSGGPIVGADGRVVGLVVARGVGQRIPTIYGVSSKELGPIVTRGAQRVPVDTGPCLEQSQLRSKLASPASLR